MADQTAILESLKVRLAARDADIAEQERLLGAQIENLGRDKIEVAALRKDLADLEASLIKPEPEPEPVAAPIAVQADLGLIRVQDAPGTIRLAHGITGADLEFSVTGAVDLTVDGDALTFDPSKIGRRSKTLIAVAAKNGGGEVTVKLQLSVGPQLDLAHPVDRLVNLSSAQRKAIFLKAKALGIGRLRTDFEWVSAFNGGSYNYNAKSITDICKEAVDAGLGVLLIWKGAGSWTTARWSDHQKHVQHFTTALAKHFAAIGVHEHELGNEPNLDSFMDNAVPVATLAAWHVATYEAIKAVDPRAVVITAGLSPVPTPSNNPTSARPAVAFLTGLLAGVGKKTDGIGFHPYFWENGPTGAQTWNGFKIYRTEVIALARKHNVPVWATEIGQPTGGSTPNRSTTEAAQAANLLTAWDMMAAEPLAGPWAIYNWSDYQAAGKTQNSEDYYGIHRVDGSEKPAAGVIRSILRAD